MTTHLEIVEPRATDAEGDQIEIPEGLIGMDEWKRFALLSHPDGGPLRLLQSLEDEHISFIITKVQQIVPDFQLALAEVDAEALNLVAGKVADWPDNLDAYAILSVQNDPFTVTANLLGPLLVRRDLGVGRQIVLSSSEYSARHLIVGPTAEVSDAHSRA